MLRIVDVSTAAIEAKVSAATIRRAVFDGELPAFGNDPLRLDLEHVLAWRARAGKKVKIEKAVIR